MEILAPKTGIAQSAHVGFPNMRNLDITSIPGIVALNNILVKRSSATVTETINWVVRNPLVTTEVYAVGNTGIVYSSTDSGVTWAVLAGNTAGGAGQGLTVWKDYLFVPRATAMDLYGPLSGTPAWRNSWAGLTMDTDALWHPLLVSRNDNKLYGGAGRFVFSIDEVTGQTFLWSNAATYTATAQALDLPSPYRIKCMKELGNNLMLGTWQGVNLYDIRAADIFPWDRSAVSFGQPISIDDYGVHAMENSGNSLTVLAGISGTVRKSDGVNATIVGQIPTDIRGGKYLEFYPGAICNYKNKIFFGTGQGGTTATPNQGIYSLSQTGQGSILNMEHSVSTLSDGTTNPLKVTALLPITRDTLLAGWRDNATYGLDLTTATSYLYTTDYAGYFETPLYTVGTSLQLKKFTNIEFQLVRPLRTGEGIKIEYRDDLTATFTTLNTYSFTDFGAVVSRNSLFIAPIDIPACETIQLRVSLLGSSTTSPEVKSINLK